MPEVNSVSWVSIVLTAVGVLRGGIEVALRTSLAARMGSGRRRAAVIGTAVLMAAGLAVAVTTVAGAQPQPSISQVQAKINTLTGQFNKADQQYDQVEEQLTAAKAQLKTLDKQVAKDEAAYREAQEKVVQIVDSNYEDSAQTSLAGLLTSNDPSTALAQASIIMEITSTRNLETTTFLTDASNLATIQAQQQHTEQGIAQLASQREKTKNHIESLLNSQKAILDSLTTTQQTQVNQGTENSGGGTTNAKDPYATATQAEKAVQFVFDQLGCPYVYAATGPCPDGFDCSGLVMSAWASAGVSIPRDTFEQWAALPHVSVNDLQIGDLLYYNGIGHVAMYVGGGMIIDAPSPGEVVRELPMSTAWYADSLDGAARP
jgi:peptidoglycan DL-endopeptidase CwlO